VKVIISAAATSDLRNIRRFIGQDNPRVAIRFVSQLRDRCLALSESHRRYPIVEKLADSDLRKRTYRGYLILYRVTQEQVVIVRILHGARDWLRLMESGGG